MRCVLNSGRYIDKSLFIKDFLECNDRLMLITYPSKWFKSTNINMLTRFLRIETDDSRISEIFKTVYGFSDQKYLFKSDYKLKISNKERVKKLKILKHADIMDNYFGKYPVIKLDLSKVQSIKDFLFYLSYHVHNIPLPDSHLDIDDINITNLIKNYDSSLFHKEYIHSKLLDCAISYLMLTIQRIHQYFGKKVFVLIDGYDEFLNKENYIKLDKKYQYYNFIKEFMKKFFLNNEHIKKAIICGNFNLEDSFFEGLNIKKYCFPFDDKFYKYFSVTDEEIQEIIDLFQLPIKLNEMKIFFGGYKILSEKKKQVMNPNSIDIFLENHNFKNEISEISMFKYRMFYLTHKNIMLLISKLLNNKNLKMDFKKNSLNFWDMFMIKNICMSKESDLFDAADFNLFLEYLVADGYLTTSGYSNKPCDRIIKSPNASEDKSVNIYPSLKY